VSGLALVKPAPAARGSKEPVEESSTLAQENDLYAAASRAAREGNDALAVASLNGLLARYPSSPLAQNVRVDRFRALNRSGRAQEAMSQARRYLADYPNGFARDEAKAIVLQALARP
jgi:outer membrane protein assembly factor BamD (BamD/ComL family)